ncbi:hypothetical protein C8R47DRAFT_1312737 [Mycena vitilis]|nr:hypothetical protein C8R47DRAFT_1312737 [Mycena vitilis]
MQQTPVPPLPAVFGLACYRCFKEEEVHLSRCSGCRRISYCSADCQKFDWKDHKPMCKALSGIEKTPMAAATLFFSLPSQPTTDLNFLHNQTEAHASNILSFCVRSLQRPLTLPEGNLIRWEPRCLVCTRTDQLIRMEAAKTGTTSEKPRQLIPCPQCNLSFCCSPAHWEAARAFHHGPCEDAHDGLSQCEINREVRGDVMFEAAMLGAQQDSSDFLWRPDRIKATWKSLEGTTWDSEFSDSLRQAVGVPASRPMEPWLRAASDNLSMAMTILYGLEQLNPDDAWTRKHTLTIHIIGANTKEINGAMVFEEILHRLPEVKTLKMVLCGPEMPGGHIPRTIALDTCAECTQRGRRRVHEHVADTYHSYVQNKATKFEKPDLAIAFNSNTALESAQIWPATLKLLHDRKIPALFTTYNREEAETEAKVLRAAGAKLHTALGPTKNPWGSIKLIPEPEKVWGFRAGSGWLAGGFK